MITINEDSLVITIPTTSALEYRDWMQRLCADYMRCYAFVPSSDRRTNDGENLIIMSELMEALIDVKN